MAQVRSHFDVDERVDLPIRSAMGQQFTNNRRKFLDATGDLGLDADEPTIPPHLQDRIIANEVVEWKAMENKRLVTKLGRMLVYCSPFGIELLRRRRDEIAIDGTFQVCLYNRVLS